MSTHADFWLVEPQDLVKKLSLLPSKRDNLDEKLNALTRLLIVFVVVLALLKWKHWEWLLIGGLAIILYIYLTKQECLIEGFNEDISAENLKYYQQAPLSSLYRVEKAPAEPFQDDVTYVSTPTAPQAAPRAEPQVAPRQPVRADPPVDNKKRAKQPAFRSINPKAKGKTASEEERASWGALRNQEIKLDESLRSSMAQSLF